MFSKNQKKYLGLLCETKGPRTPERYNVRVGIFSEEYQRKLRHEINTKLFSLVDELDLLFNSGYLQEAAPYEFYNRAYGYNTDKKIRLNPEDSLKLLYAIMKKNEKQFDSAEYSAMRFKEHFARYNELMKMIEGGDNDVGI